MLVRVHGGTPVQEGDSLCDTCRHARIVRGRRLDEALVVCGALVMEVVRITFKVTSCTEYSDDREPTYHELFEKAWILRPPTKRRPAGFIRSTDLTPAEVRRIFARDEGDE
jgi:hypothetical protein